MKTKASKQPKQSKPAVGLNDIRPKTNPTGGRSTITADDVLSLKTGDARRA